MKVLITGAGGFIGSHLTERCVEMGYEVTAFVRYNSKNNWGWLEDSDVKNKIKVISGDIRDFDSVKNAMMGCDIVFHLAALIGIPYSYVSPLAYIRTNVEGTYNILQASRELKTKNILVTSTSETYGSAQYVPIDEKHPSVGQSPYSASKISSDQIALSYHLSFGLPVKIVRPFNTYGPRQSARAIIPTIISQILGGASYLNLGNVDPTRDLTFVRDTVEGFIEIANSDKLVGQTTNIGMNQEISILSLAEYIIKLMNADVKINSASERTRPENSEVQRLKCDNTKIINLTSWGPKYELSSGLTETIEWMKKNMKYYKPELYTI